MGEQNEKFTPGPWNVSSANSYEIRIEFHNGIEGQRQSGHVCTVDGMRGERLRANAHLIASAPELYEALERIAAIVRVSDQGGGTAAEWALEEIPGIIESALRSARGEK